MINLTKLQEELKQNDMPDEEQKRHNFYQYARESKFVKRFGSKPIMNSYSSLVSE